MKANAPEKIYVHKSQYWGLMANEHNITKKDVEYIRTDAFIEKACMWLLLNADDYIVDGVEEHSSAMRHDFIEEFRKAMSL